MTSDTSRPPSTNDVNFAPRPGTDLARLNQAASDAAANRLDDARYNPLCRARRLSAHQVDPAPTQDRVKSCQHLLGRLQHVTLPRPD